MFINENIWLRMERLNEIASKILKDILVKLVMDKKIQS